MKNKIIVISSIIFILLISLTFFIKNRKPQKSSLNLFSEVKKELIRINCEGAVVDSGPVKMFGYAYGYVYPLKTLEYTAPSGGKVIFFRKREGERVEKGELIIKIDDRELVYKLKSLKQKLQSMQIFISKGDTFNPEYYETLYEYNKLKREIDMLNFRAPWNGYLADVNVFEGDIVSEGKELFKLINSDSLKVKIFLMPNEIYDVKEGDTCFIETGSKIIKGKIQSIGNYASEEGVPIIILLKNDKEILPGIYVKVKILKKYKKKTLRVPNEAILEREGKELIFVVKKGFAKWKYIKTGLKGEEFTEILSKEIKPGDTVIIKGHTFLSHNSPVNVKNVKKNN